MTPGKLVGRRSRTCGLMDDASCGQEGTDHWNRSDSQDKHAPGDGGEELHILREKMALDFLDVVDSR